MTILFSPRQLEWCYGTGRGIRTAMGNKVEMVETDAASKPGHVARHHDRGLVTIGAFKLIESVFFLLVGVGVIHFIHRDLGDEATRLAERLRFDLDGKLMTWVMDHLDSITAHRMKQISALTFFYAGLRIAEGVGLVMEKLWAEYLTVWATTIFLPWEVYEICRHLDWIRVSLLVINLSVLAYLVWAMRKNRRLAELARNET